MHDPQVPGKITITREGVRFMAIAADVTPDSFFGIQFFSSLTELEVRNAWSCARYLCTLQLSCVILFAALVAIMKL
jgi:hypothetical protein